MSSYLPQVVCNQRDRCGEGPLWDWRNQMLVWTDAGSSIIYSLTSSDASVSVLSRGIPSSGLGLGSAGGYLVAGENGLFRLSPSGAELLIRNHDGKKLLFNDLLVDPRGRVYVGTYYWGDEMLEPGALYLVDESLKVQIVADNIMLANGLGLSPDHRILYFADTAARVIYAFNVEPEDGSLSNRRTFARIPPEEGLPDGLTVDSEGYVWNAHWYGSEVVRYDPDGVVERRIQFPSKQISSVAFGGPDLTDLYVTSAGESWPSGLMPPKYDPHSGCIGGALYRVSLDIAGRAEFVSKI